MRFTSNEMMFFHSITEGDDVFGFRFYFPRDERMEEAKEKTITGLIKKGILDDKDKLSTEGFYPIKALEDYKKSTKHIIVNHIHLAPLKNDDMVMIYPVEKEYELCIINNVVLLHLFLKKYKFLCEKKSYEKEIMDQPGLDIVLQELYENENNILIGEFIEQKAVREQVFYVCDDKCYKYDFISGKRYQTDGYKMRMELSGLLNLESGD